MGVDIWALGVAIFGLLAGSFPFKDEAAVQKLEPRLPRDVHPTCADFVRRMLLKDESRRSSADDVVSHEWINSSMKTCSQAFERSALQERSESIDSGASTRVNSTASVASTVTVVSL